jgi:hypothetical protein
VFKPLAETARPERRNVQMATDQTPPPSATEAQGETLGADPEPTLPDFLPDGVENLPPGMCYAPYIGTVPCPSTSVSATQPDDTLPVTGGGESATAIMQGGVLTLTVGILLTALARRRRRVRV